MTFEQWWIKNTHLESKRYPRKEVVKKAWDAQEIKIETLKKRLTKCQDILKYRVNDTDRIVAALNAK